AYRFIETCRGENPKAWFLTIVRNTAFSWLQRNRLQPLVSLEEIHEAAQIEMMVDPETPESILLAEEAKRRLHEASRTLSAAHREVMALREEQDMTYQEIAERIGIPTGTVMSRLARARAALVRRRPVGGMS